MVDIGHAVEKRNGKDQALAGGGDSRKSVCGCIAGARPVLDGVRVAQEFDQVLLLFGSLDYLIHQVLQTLMIGNNGERMAEEVATPFTDGGSDGMEFPDIGGRTLQPGAESLAKIRNWMSIL